MTFFGRPPGKAAIYKRVFNFLDVWIISLPWPGLQVRFQCLEERSARLREAELSSLSILGASLRDSGILFWSFSEHKHFQPSLRLKFVFPFFSISHLKAVAPTSQALLCLAPREAEGSVGRGREVVPARKSCWTPVGRPGPWDLVSGGCLKAVPCVHFLGMP